VTHELLKVSATGTGALAGSAGIMTTVMGFFDHYAAGIGAISTVIFGVIYVVFQYLSYKKSTLANENAKELKELRNQIAGISNRQSDKGK